MTPWRWWATAECCHADGDWQLGDFATRDEAIAAADAEYAPGTPFFIVEARTTTDVRYYDGGHDIVPFVRTRNEERLTAQGTEARRAETVQQGSVHDGPVRDSECAQPQEPSS